ncbi:MAG: hypothetical protein AAGC64_13170 [Bacteroidota bacterium]
MESFAKLDFWFKSKLSELQKHSLLVVNEAFEILSNEELGQKASFSKDSNDFVVISNVIFEVNLFLASQHPLGFIDFFCHEENKYQVYGDELERIH